MAYANLGVNKNNKRMTLFQIYEMVQYYLNKDYEGNVITPDKFKELIIAADLDLFKRKIGLPEDYQLEAPISREYIDANKIATTDIRHLKVRAPTQAVTTGVVAFPSEYCVEDALRYNYQRNVDGSSVTITKAIEVLTEDQYGDRAGSWVKKPTTKNPVCVIRQDGIYVYPASISVIDFNYYRYPTEPVFAYNQESGYITYDSGGSTEFDWPKRLHMDLVRIILSYIAVNLREREIVQYAEAKKREGV